MSCGLVPTCEGASRGGGLGGGRFAEDEELDEGANEDHDGELTEEESFCKREAGLVSVVALTWQKVTYED